MNEFKTDVSRKFEITFTTDEEANYEVMQAVARRLIDKEPLLVVNAEEYELMCAENADYSALREVLETFMKEIYNAIHICPHNLPSVRTACVKALGKAKEALNDI